MADDTAPTTSPSPTTNPVPKTMEQVLAQHPASEQLRPFFPATVPDDAAAPADFRPTGLTRDDYLPVVAGIVDFFLQHQDERGAIIDPYEKAEKQYSTPCFAHAAALLVNEAGREDLVEPASRALTFSINALANKTAADKHPDFYAPPVMHAVRLLEPHVPADVYDRWVATLRPLVPEKTYAATQGHGNWNLVNVCGEVIRATNGWVSPELLEAHTAYVERCLAIQAAEAFTKFGLYWDGAIVPMAYDAFPRLWLEEMLAGGDYDGPSREAVERFLTLGGFSSLLLQSPTGEWAPGGRSSHHQWNEAEIAVIFEINANRWKALGRDDVAGAYKRAARLALSSVDRWRRPSGELWIVKNRADPQRRHGSEGYSFHSQYNLLAAAMLAIAYERADEDIAERPTPSEVGGYVFDARDKFYKVAAAAGDYYVLIDTASDQHYNSTGLQRVHRAAVPYSPLSDSAAEHRWYGPKEDETHAALSPGLQWRQGDDDEWLSLAHFRRFTPGNDRNGNPLPIPQRYVKDVDLKVEEASPSSTTFTLTYHLVHGGNDIDLTERYALGPDGVRVTASLDGVESSAARVVLPALVSDGANDTDVQAGAGGVTIGAAGGTLDYRVESPEGVSFTLEGPRVPAHTGYFQAAVADLPTAGAAPTATWTFRLRSVEGSAGGAGAE